MQLIDGKATAKAIKEEIKEEVIKLVQAGQRPPHLAAILVGHDGGSETYVAYKIKDCEEVGFRSSLIRFEDDVVVSEQGCEVISAGVPKTIVEIEALMGSR